MRKKCIVILLFFTVNVNTFGQPESSVNLINSLSENAIALSGKKHADLMGLLALEAQLFSIDLKQINNLVFNALYYSLKEVNSDLVKNFNSFDRAGNVEIKGSKNSESRFLIHESGKVVSLHVEEKKMRELMPAEDGLTIKSTAFNPKTNQLVMVGYKKGKGMITLFNTSNPVGYNKEKKLNGIIGTSANAEGEIYLLSDQGRIISQFLEDNIKEVVKTDKRLASFLVTNNYLYGGTWDGELIKWSKDGKNQKIIQSGNVPFNFLANINSEGTAIAFGDASGMFYIYKEGVEPVMVPGHKASLTSIDYSENGKYIVTGSMDNTIKIWNFENRLMPPITIADFKGRVTGVAFSKNADKILVATDEKAVVELPFDVNVMASELCEKINRDLTQAEWSRFLGNSDYHSTCKDINNNNQ